MRYGEAAQTGHPHPWHETTAHRSILYRYSGRNISSPVTHPGIQRRAANIECRFTRPRYIAFRPHAARTAGVTSVPGYRARGGTPALLVARAGPLYYGAWMLTAEKTSPGLRDENTLYSKEQPVA